MAIARRKESVRFRRSGSRRWVATVLALALVLNLFLPFLTPGIARAEAVALDAAISAGLYDSASICHAGASGPEQPQDHDPGPLCPLCQVLCHHGAFAPTDAAVLDGPTLAAAQFPIPPPSVPTDRTPIASPRLPRAPPTL